ncbi:MAG: alcohol dehydrogenase catalytic domain-containing protein, partial [Myxococcota bacterium]
MRQLTCIGPGKIEWQDVPEPRLAGDLEALVRPLTVARCDIDRLLIDGVIPQRGPFALGHEAVVEIVALGDQVRGLALGQRAVVSFQVSCGECRACKLGRTANCDRYPAVSDYGMQPLSGTEYGGMLSDLVRVPHASAMLQPISTKANALALASVSDNVLDGYRAVAPHLREQPGSDVLIVHHGASSIALYAAQAALALGAARVDFASADVETLALAERLGAQPLQTDFGRRLRRYPIVVDSGIRPEALDFALRCTEPEGICQSVSLYVGAVPLPLVRMYT